MVTLEAMGLNQDAAALQSGELKMVMLGLSCFPDGKWHGWTMIHSPQSEDIDHLSGHQGVSSI
jgi:hypothetical protein